MVRQHTTMKKHQQEQYIITGSAKNIEDIYAATTGLKPFLVERRTSRTGIHGRKRRCKVRYKTEADFLEAHMKM